jgi:hypothetical protein
VIDSVEASVRRGRNADGGWGYYSGKASRLEPTCWAFLALTDLDPDVLRTWPVRDGLLLERVGGDPNYAFHALAMLVMSVRRVEHAAGNKALLDGIQRVRGEQLPESSINRQDNRLQAWSWIDGTFSWVEPTAWCLLTLKKLRKENGARVDAKRVADAEALLIDRCCVNGGWNYGNANMLGQELPAYVPTTAAALLALQDKPSEPAFVRSRDYLNRDATAEQSALALSLALIAMNLLGQATDRVKAALADQLAVTISLGNHLNLALSLYALREHDHGAFTL